MTPPKSTKLVTARVGGRVVGLDIMSVRKILPFTPPTRLPHQGPAVLGVINLRGTVIPVFDLAERLGWGRAVPSDRSVMMVIEAAGREQAMLVDAEGDIVEIDPTSLQPAPVIDGRPSPLVAGLVETPGDEAEPGMIVLLSGDALAMGTELA